MVPYNHVSLQPYLHCKCNFKIQQTFLKAVSVIGMCPEIQRKMVDIIG